MTNIIFYYITLIISSVICVRFVHFIEFEYYKSIFYLFILFFITM